MQLAPESNTSSQDRASVCRFIHHASRKASSQEQENWFTGISSMDICAMKSVVMIRTKSIRTTGSQAQWNNDTSAFLDNSTRFARSRCAPSDTKTHEKMIIWTFLVLKKWQQTESRFVWGTSRFETIRLNGSRLAVGKWITGVSNR